MAFDFVGSSSQRLLVNSAPATVVPLTIALWFRVPSDTIRYSLATISANGTPPIQGQGGFFHMMTTTAGRVLGGVDPNGTAAATTTTSHQPNAWNHAAFIATSNTSRTVYLNGGGANTNTVNYSVSNTMNRFEVGRFVDSFDNYITGQVADVGIWNAALTADDVLSLSRGIAASYIRPQSLVFHAPLIRDLIDVRRGVPITNTNGATVAVHPRMYY